MVNLLTDINQGLTIERVVDVCAEDTFTEMSGICAFPKTGKQCEGIETAFRSRLTTILDLYTIFYIVI